MDSALTIHILVDFRQYVLKRMDCESEEEALDAVKEVPPAPE